jgi:hypothetical protein
MEMLLFGWCVVLALILLFSLLHAQYFTPYNLYALDLQRRTIAHNTSISDAGEFDPSRSPDGRYLVHEVTTVAGFTAFLGD